MADKFTNLYKMITDGYDMDQSFLRGVIYTLEWLDEHPEQVPRPRMTYSELAEEVKSVERVEKRFEAVAYVLTNLGFTICSDPEPTNAEKLEALLEGGNINAQWALRDGGVMFARELAHALDDAGVKAPGGDDD